MNNLFISIAVFSFLLASSASPDTDEEPYLYEDFGRCRLAGTCRRTSMLNGTWEDSGVAYKLERLCLERARTFFRWCGNEGCEPVEALYLPTGNRRRYPESCQIQPTQQGQQGEQSREEGQNEVHEDGVTQNTPHVASSEAQDSPFKAFEAMQDEVISNLSEAKVLLLRINPFTGFANRIFAIASSMILCLVLGDRGLLVDWPVDQTARKHPNKELSFMPPLHDLLDVPHILDYTTVVSSRSEWKFHEDEKTWHSFQDDDENFLSLLRGEEQLGEHFRSRVIQMYSSYGFFYSHLILNNPHLRAPLERMMGKKCCFHPVLKYLMKPSKLVAFRLWRMNRSWAGQANFTGIHLRTFLMSPETRLTALRCASYISERKGNREINIFTDAERGIQEADRFFNESRGLQNLHVRVQSDHGRSSLNEVPCRVCPLANTLTRCFVGYMPGCGRSCFSPSFVSERRHGGNNSIDLLLACRHVSIEGESVIDNLYLLSHAHRDIRIPLEPSIFIMCIITGVPRYSANCPLLQFNVKRLQNCWSRKYSMSKAND
eukprot:757760-Hanusia_phi.AAC.2